VVSADARVFATGVFLVQVGACAVASLGTNVMDVEAFTIGASIAARSSASSKSSANCIVTRVREKQRPVFFATTRDVAGDTSKRRRVPGGAVGTRAALINGGGSGVGTKVGTCRWFELEKSSEPNVARGTIGFWNSRILATVYL
tara:strand:+ start:567 stop:998 length:432 start_codon:yes stop_codon:yes gene_type:complete